MQSYLNLDFGKVKVRCPYWINKINKGIRGPFSGKGTPGQIIKSAYSSAKREGIDIDKLKSYEITKLLKRNRIGVDCSGFAYHVLDTLDREKGGNGIADDLFLPAGRQAAKPRFPAWNPAWRASADLLTSEIVTKVIMLLNDVKVGDMIRTENGRHIYVTVDVSKKNIICSHSSSLLARDGGVNLQAFSKDHLKNNDKISIRRFKWW